MTSNMSSNASTFFARNKARKKCLWMTISLRTRNIFLYSFFKVGTMNKAIVHQYNIPQKLMDPVDVDNLKKKKKKKDESKK